MESWRDTFALVVVRSAPKTEAGYDGQGVALPAGMCARDNIGGHKRTAARGSCCIGLI
jgi:hypothetical protein